MSAFTRTLVLSTAVIIFVVCLAAMLLARLFVRPIRRLEAGAQQISSGDYNITLPVQSRDEFGDLTVAFNDMSRNLAIKEELLAEQRRENDRLMLSLMPEPVVQRYREGEETIAQDHQDVTVIFADIVGLDELSAELNSDELLAIVNKLTRQFDAAAENLGVEQVRTLHNGYLASCGLSVPRLDNVRRTVDFADRDAAHHRPVQRRDRPRPGAAGRHRHRHGDQRPGRARSTLAYDMWGSAVNLAYQVQSGSPQTGRVRHVGGVRRDARQPRLHLRGRHHRRRRGATRSGGWRIGSHEQRVRRVRGSTGPSGWPSASRSAWSSSPSCTTRCSAAAARSPARCTWCATTSCRSARC